MRTSNNGSHLHTLSIPKHSLHHKSHHHRWLTHTAPNETPELRNTCRTISPIRCIDRLNPHTRFQASAATFRSGHRCLRHRPRSLFGNGAVTFQRRLRNTQHFDLGGIRAGDEAAAESGGTAAGGVQRDGLDVGIAGVVRHQPRGGDELPERGTVLLLAHPHQAQRVVQFGVSRHDGQPLAQNLLYLRFAPLLAPGIGEVDLGAGETRVELDGPLVGGQRLIGTALAEAAGCEVGRIVAAPA